MATKSISKNPIIKDLFSKKYKPKIKKPKKGRGSFKRVKTIFTKKYKPKIVKPRKGKGSFKRKKT